MFVDDDEAFLEIVRRVCERIPAVDSVLTDLDGARGLETLRHLHATKQPLPHTIFVDINMPVLDGFGFLEGLNALRESIGDVDGIKRVVMLTSSDQERDRARAKELGAQDYIVKGWSLRDLTDTIQRFA